MKNKEKKNEQGNAKLNTSKIGANVKANEGKKEKGNKKKLFIIISVVVLLLVAAIVTTVILLNRTKNINLSECIKIEYEGYEGYATATVGIDSSKLSNQIGNKDIAKKFEKKAELKAENTTNLSNGDEIKITVSISNSFLEENKLELKNKKVTIKASGIKESEKIDLSKYVNLEYDGFNKHATAKVDLDKSLEKDIGSDAYKAIKNYAKFTIENDGELENDKDAEITVDISDSTMERYGVKIESKEFKVKVSGLSDATEIEAFEGMKVNISGMSPNITVSITNENTDEFAKTVTFTASKTRGLANGDTITIIASNWDKTMAKEEGYALKSTTMEYKIENQAAYVSQISEITPEIKEKMKNLFVEKAKSKTIDAEQNVYVYTDYKFSNVAGGNSYFLASDTIKQDLTIGNPEIVAMYLLTKKASVNSDDTNKMVAIVRVPYTSDKTNATYNWYITVSAKNFSLTNDGNISENAIYDVKLSDGDNQEKAYDEYVNREKNYFDVVNIPLN